MRSYLQASIVVFGLVIFLYAAARAEPPEQKFLVIDGVENVQTYQFDDSQHLQVDYSVDLEYPSLAIGKSQWEELKRRGWSRCASVLGKPCWRDFLDSTTGDTRAVHQHLSYWVKDNRHIVIAMKYYSAFLDPSTRVDEVADEPDNSTQYVTIVFDTYDYDEIEIVEELLEVSCP